MRFPTARPAVVVLAAALFSRAALAQTEEAAPVKAPANKGKLVAAEFCPYGTIGSPVGISVDDRGRVFVTETARRTNGELDIRKHMDFLVGTLASRTIEDKRAFIRTNYHRGDAGDANHDGVEDWRDLLVPTEKVWRLTDADGDGKFDEKRVFADGFNDEVTGVAGGVLAFGGDVYVTIQPDLWKLTDTDGDGKADARTSLSHGHGVHIGYGGHDMHGPTMGPDGRIYWSQGDKGFSLVTKEGKTLAKQYEGGVFRVDPDGSNLEVFAHGLRNVQEIAFDDFGNLFGVDNDADIGDRERFVYITESSDSGWRSTYQYRNQQQKGVFRGGYNPWMAEELWKPKFETQAAYITPPLANYSDGPCGFKFNPGTALSEEYKGCFFLTHFPKKLLTCFRAVPDGAAFKMADERLAFGGLMMTGIAFGPDGAIYSADWGENAWAPHQKGRVAKIDVPGDTPSAQRVETKRLLAEGMSQRTDEEVTAFLGHADQRVRLRAQFELVSRAAAKGAVLQQLCDLARTADAARLARVHAVWALGQLARRAAAAPAAGDGAKTPAEGRAAAGTTVVALAALLTDKDEEIRAQAAKVLGDARAAQTADAIAPLLANPSPRVRFHAAVALSKVIRPTDLPAVVAMLTTNKTRDAYLRHAAVVALSAIGARDAKAIAGLAAHADRQVRLAAVVALRRLASPLVAAFLDDQDDWVVAEAARAIHDDESIADALPALAAYLDRATGSFGRTGNASAAATPPVTNEVTLRRAVNANVRVGDAAAAGRLVAFAISAAPAALRAAALRADALDALAWFASPSKLDRVEGRFREYAARDEKVVQAALDPALTRLLNDPAPAVRAATVTAIEQLHFNTARDRLVAIAADEAQSPALRAAALPAIVALKAPQARDVVAAALKSADAKLRAAALGVVAQLDPSSAATLAALKSALATATVPEQQAALAALAAMKSKDATALLAGELDRLIAGNVPAPLQLDVVEAAAGTKDKGLAAKLAKYKAAKPKSDLLAAHAEALEGGDAAEGQALFTTGQCAQCHAINGTGGNVGPDLSHVAGRLSRRDVLESIVLPNAKLAEGFATVSVTTKDGDTYTGTIQADTPDAVTLRDPQTGELVKVRRGEIDSQTKPVSAMPPMAEVLKPREIRSVVEYLMTLK